MTCRSCGAHAHVRECSCGASEHRLAYGLLSDEERQRYGRTNGGTIQRPRLLLLCTCPQLGLVRRGCPPKSLRPPALGCAPKALSLHSCPRMQCPTLDAARAACELPLERLHTIARDMVHEMRQGLAAEGCQLMMLPSHVTSLPDGCVPRQRSLHHLYALHCAWHSAAVRRLPCLTVRSERGAWYALDLGGTNFRVLRLLLSDVAGSIAGVEVRRAAAPLRSRADALLAAHALLAWFSSLPCSLKRLRSLLSCWLARASRCSPSSRSAWWRSRDATPPVPWASRFRSPVRRRRWTRARCSGGPRVLRSWTAWAATWLACFAPRWLMQARTSSLPRLSTTPSARWPRRATPTRSHACLSFWAQVRG